MEGFEVLVAIVTVLAAVLLFFAVMAYKKERSMRLLLISVVFALFLVKGLVMTLSIFTTTLEDTSNSLIFHLSFDVVILLFLFFTALQRPKSKEEADSAPKDKKEEKT